MHRPLETRDSYNKLTREIRDECTKNSYATVRLENCSETKIVDTYYGFEETEGTQRWCKDGTSIESALYDIILLLRKEH